MAALCRRHFPDSGRPRRDQLYGHPRLQRFRLGCSQTSYAPTYTLIEPSYGHLWSDFKCGTSQHPHDDVTRGEGLIKATYEAIRNSPVWNSSVMVITWDEHGGFYDHLPPPAAMPPGDWSPEVPIISTALLSNNMARASRL